MDILKDIEKFNPENKLKQMKKLNDSCYNTIESIYNFILKNLNKDFYLNENYKMFYYEQLNNVSNDIARLHNEITNECDYLNDKFIELSTTLFGKIPKKQLIKMIKFCIDAIELNMQTLKKLTELSIINKDTVIFISKYLTDFNFRLYTPQKIETIPLYAKSLNELAIKAEEYQVKILSKLKPAFNRAKTCRKNDFAFVLVTKNELDALKGYNYIFKEPVDFPIWDIEHYKDITFENGKANCIFKEFTPFA